MASYNVMKNVQIINEIIEIESAAQELVKNARLEQADLPMKISAVLDKYEAHNSEKAKERIKRISSAEETLAKEKIERIYQTHEEKITKLKKITDENIDSWIEKIYAFLIRPTEL